MLNFWNSKNAPDEPTHHIESRGLCGISLEVKIQRLIAIVLEEFLDIIDHWEQVYGSETKEEP